MADNDRTLNNYQLLTLNPKQENTELHSAEPDKRSFWQRVTSWNTVFKIGAFGLLTGGAVAVGFGIMSALWPISIPLASIVTAAATGVWLISTYKPIFNTMAKWDSNLDGLGKQLDEAEDLIKDISKLNKKLTKN